MFKTRVEELKTENWNYERFGFQSTLLKRDFHCGLFRSSSGKTIEKTLYVLHGGGADDSQVVLAGLLPVFANLLSKWGLENTQIVLPYVGNSFLHDHPDKSKSFSDYFLREVLPSCEASTQTNSQTRFLAGWSMGGQAALNLLLRHPQQFAGVGVHFPTLVNFDYNDPKQQQAYAARKKVSPEMMKILVGEFQKEFLDNQDFAAHDPLRLATALAPEVLSQKKIYFDVGQDDEFGLAEGCEVFHQILDRKKAPHHFEVIPNGKHDAPLIHGQIPKLLRYLL